MRELFETLNENTRNNYQKLNNIEQTMCDNLDVALEKLPKANGIKLTRDLIFSNEEDLEQFIFIHNFGNIVDYEAYSSCTALAIYQDEPTVRLIINNARQATNVSIIKGADKEYLYGRNHKFRVKRISNKGFVEIELEEL